MLCETCGLPNPPDAMNCGRCGAGLAPAAAAPAAPPPGYGPPPDYGLPPGYGPSPAYSRSATVTAADWYQIRGIGTGAAIVLGLSAVAAVLSALLGTAESGIGVILGIAQLAAVVMVLIWFHQARGNAAWSGWRQPLARPWAIWGWFVPIIFLWFPVRIISGIWRASQPRADRGKPMLVVATWWSCWLLAWFTGYRQAWTTVQQGSSVSVSSASVGLYFEGTLASKLFAAAAAILLGYIVWTVSTGPLGADAPGELT